MNGAERRGTEGNEETEEGEETKGNEETEEGEGGREGRMGS